MDFATNIAVAVLELTKYDFILAYVTEDIKKQKEIVNAIRDPWFVDTWMHKAVNPEEVIRNWTDLADSLVEKYEENPKKFKKWLHESLDI